MERVLSEEEKIRRAIEISERRNNASYRRESTRVNVNDKKDYKLFKKMILQIIICLLIYTIFYLISSTNYVFSDEVIQSTNQILSYDINFSELYNNFLLLINDKEDKNENFEENTINLQSNNTVNILETNNTVINDNIVKNDTTNTVSNTVENTNKQGNNDIKKEEEKSENKQVSKTKTQMDLDAEKVKKLCKFIKPLSGTITSEFGEREVILNGMTSDHKGIDIAANSGTNIKAAMEGKVTVAEENSEYGKFIKIVNGDVMTVYAHCQKLKVKVGEKIKLRTNNSNRGFDREFNRTSFTF